MRPVATRRRFSSGDLNHHLDMVTIGQVCLGVTFSNYSKFLDAVFHQESGSLALLLLALDRAEVLAIRAPAHSLKGETSALGLKSLASLLHRCEEQGSAYSPQACQAVATELRECWATTQALCHRMGLSQTA